MTEGSLTSLNVQDGHLEIDGNTFDNVLSGTWDIRMVPGKATIYLHNTVGVEAAMKLYIWEDFIVAANYQVRCTKNLEGQIIGIVTKVRNA